ncbi:hypothetical protein BFW01_g1850 [Lasiodiplodia theobromae]|uniref:Uncharacterized protein n=1 Tax=Lasiodiplodia theobromae TaxID=45133 RepID=A0A8H7IS62_9PEZI|nr:hypothetical protein BFW01_g1850 [Lasiodiplodia theobromae]
MHTCKGFTGLARAAETRKGSLNYIHFLFDRGADTLRPRSHRRPPTTPSSPQPLTSNDHISIARILSALRIASAPLPMSRDPTTRGTTMHIAAATPLTSASWPSSSTTLSITPRQPPHQRYRRPPRHACFAACHRNVSILLARGTKPGTTGLRQA